MFSRSKGENMHLYRASIKKTDITQDQKVHQLKLLNVQDNGRFCLSPNDSRPKGDATRKRL